MKWTYNTGIFLYALAAKFFGLFNTKARQFSEGHARVFDEIIACVPGNKQHVWFHFASLGEFEQGRPVMEQFKAIHPEKELIVTFFSPSGYEIRKNYALAKGVFYLPMDTAANARRFIELINPEFVVFTKYEFWYYYFRELHQKAVPLYIISGIFRKEQAFFKWYGGFNREILGFVSHFFVQNEESVALLRSIGLNTAEVSGDTRFDRVAENAENPKNMSAAAAFCGNAHVLICGSTWPDDEKILSALPEKYPDWKFIIVPHEVDPEHIHKLSAQFPGSIKYSSIDPGLLQFDAQVMIIDSIGLLSSLYQYGTIAYIGGGFGAGIHNTLEAAAFGLPVIFGPEYAKFQEAKDLIRLSAAKSIDSEQELIKAFTQFMQDKNASAIAKKYVTDKKGATARILKAILSALPAHQ